MIQARQEAVTVLRLDTRQHDAAAAGSAAALQSLARSGVASAQSVANAMRALPAAFGALGIGTLVNQVNQGLLRIKDLSEATGSSIAMVSALDGIARRTGTGFDAVATSLIRFNGQLSDIDSNEAAADVLRRLGLNAAELKRQDPSEALRRTALALSGVADDGDRARAVQELFGRSVREVAPFLRELAEAEKLVGTTTELAVRQADIFEKSLAGLHANATEAGRALAGPLVSGLNEFFQQLRTGLDAYGGRPLAALFDIGLNVNPFRSINENLTDTIRQFRETRQQIDELRSSALPDIFGVRARSVAELEQKLVILNSRERYLLGQLGAAGGGRGGDPNARPLPALGSASVTPRARPAPAAPAPAPQLDTLGDFIFERVLPDAQRRDDARSGEALDYMQRQLIQRRDLLQQLVAANFEANVALIADDRQRALAQLAIERQQLQRRIEAITESGPDRAAAEAEADAAFAARAQATGMQFARDTALVTREETRDALANAFRDTQGRPLQAFGRALGEIAYTRLSKGLADALVDLTLGPVGGSGGLLGSIGSFFGLGDFFGGGRAGGGPVRRGGLYEVNEERGPGEVFNTRSGRSYLLAAEDGDIQPQPRRGARSAAPATAGQSIVFNYYGDTIIGSNVSRSEIAQQMVLERRANQAAIVDTLRRNRMLG